MINIWFGTCLRVFNNGVSLQMRRICRRVACFACLLFFGENLQTQAAGEFPLFASKGFIQAGGVNLQVTSYSAPTYADWNNDGLPDLIVGEKNGNYGENPNLPQ